MVGLRTSQIVIKKYVCNLYMKSILILINSSEGGFVEKQNISVMVKL